MHDDDDFSGYEDDVNDEIQKGFNGEKNVTLIIPPARETIEFPKVLVTTTTLDPKTQRTFEKMQKLMATGIIAIIILGLCLVLVSGLCTVYGIRYVQLENERMIEEIRLKNWKGASDTQNGVMPLTPPKDHK